MGCFPPQLPADQRQHFAYWQALNAEIIWLQDNMGVCTAFFWQWAETFGCQPQAMVTTEIFQQWITVDNAIYTTALQRVGQGGLPETLDGTFQWADQTFPLKLLVTAIGAGQLLVVGFPQAVAPSSLSPLSYQKALSRIARKIRNTFDLTVIRQEAMNGLGKTLQVSRCLLLTADATQSRFQVEAEYRCSSVPSCLGASWRSPDSPVLEEIYQTQVSQSLTTLCPALADSQAVLILPTLYQGSVNGFICLQQCDRPRIWQEVEQEFAQELAEQLGTAIAHATLYQELEQLHQAATEAARLKNDFLANTTHELRTPLNGIIGFLTLVLDEMADGRAEELDFIAAAHESALHLLNLINDILDIAKIESGKLDLDLQPISLGELLDNLNNFARPQLQTKNLTWEMLVPESHDDIILYGDYQRLFQVLLNLVGNAIKFTNAGGITINVELVFKPVIHDDQQFPGMVKISVIDTGIGVALDMQSKLFQNFSQVRGGHTRKYGGTGLGLAISKKLVEACGGKISFYSMGEGLGSTVTFSVLLQQKPVLKQPKHQDPQVII
ncbi:ATP-binding protein [Picosynechococcus sp. PCC 7117]|uniref:GAF domain-containing sensor histidine kinase n=1 Tax=Picosynechococcus sp. PCC 7117 TaxID=195498 RepID=UPI000810BF1F|nr:ATP-binding protein [Picosynechococcus sp. PCC 7117]ANV86383.1 histidine kinase [Picosynechococcus sp. PCC 7117]